jgi:hypothetical protein
MSCALLRRQAWSLVGLIGLLLFIAGCGRSETATSEAPPPEVKADPAPAPDASRETAESKPPSAAVRLDRAAAHVEDGELAEAEKIFRELKERSAELSAADVRRLAELEAKADDKREAMADEKRQHDLARAEKALADGELEAATAALETVLAAAPTPEQTDAANRLKTTIEDHRRAQRVLRSALEQLGSEKRSDIKAARTLLWQNQEAALPMLLKTLRSDNPVLVENTLETLRMFNQPDRTVPAMVGVLSRADQSASWPAAIRELEKSGYPGAGEPLLKLALSADNPEQRQAALHALAGVVDPPANTLVALLPLIYSDGPELASALTAAHRAIALHRQSDLAARRGLDAELSPDEERQLDGLAQRLAAIAAAEGPEAPRGPAAEAALTLAVVTRQIMPQPLAGVVVARYVGEDPTGPAAAVLDGVWNMTEAKTLWRHPIDKQAQIVFDLGEERTVTGVRIWNYNETSVAYRGWKEVEIYVSPTPALLAPAAEGLVPPAPGASDTADYSVTISVPFVRGRYVKIQPRSYWRPESVSGLSEVQVLGF